MSAHTPANWRPGPVMPYHECSTTSVEDLRPLEAGPLTHTQGLHSLPDPDQPGLHKPTSDSAETKRRPPARPPARPRALLRDPSARCRKGPHGPRRHFLSAIAPLAGIRLRAWRHSALSGFQVPFGSTQLPPSFTAQSHLPRPPGSRSHFQSCHGSRPRTSETTVLEWWAARQAEEIDRPPRCREARAVVPPFLHACATRVPRSASLVSWVCLTDSRVPNQGAKLRANATKRFLELSWNSTRPGIPKALETLCACGDCCFGVTST